MEIILYVNTTFSSPPNRMKVEYEKLGKLNFYERLSSDALLFPSQLSSSRLKILRVVASIGWQS